MTNQPPPRDSTTHATSDTPAATIRVRAAQLDVIGGPDAGRTARIDEPSFLIGTGSAADLRLSDDTVSREHLRISLAESGVRLRDLGSTNGTWLNTLRINDIVIAQSATITVGANTKITLTLESVPIELPVSTRDRFGDAVGSSDVMRRLFALLERAAPTEVTVLMEGESGVGKDVLAHGLHVHSSRVSGPYVTLDCGSIPAGVIESELFGHERGAFTGADRAREGAFEQADGGTLFLDEIGELPLDMQPKLLRVLETREVKRVGGRVSRKVDVRIIAATNRNLGEAARRDEFRRDLYYRLAVVRLRVPPLRERQGDILTLAASFVEKSGDGAKLPFPPELATMLVAYPWPGNVRELKNAMQRFAVFGASPLTLFDRLPDSASSSARGVAAAETGATVLPDLSNLPYHDARTAALEHFERAYFPAILARAGNVVVRAAALAQVGRGSFHRMLRRIRPGGPSDADSHDIDD